MNQNLALVSESVAAVVGSDLAAQFSAMSGLRVRRDVTGVQLTTFAIGGSIPHFIEPQSVTELVTAVRALRDLNQSYQVIGAGSNVLVPDDDTPDWVIRLGRGFRSLTSAGGGEFLAGGSSSLMSLSRDLSNLGFAGLEFAGGIPASLGGAVRMNAGAHGGEMVECLSEISFVTPDGVFEQCAPEALSFSYRHSGLPHGAIVVSAKLKLTESSREATAKLRSTFLSERKRRQPLSVPTAGSVFKNPSAELTAGMVLEKAGLKGLQVGGAHVSRLHANWIINPGRTATAKNVSELIELCQKKAKEHSGVSLEPEIQRW